MSTGFGIEIPRIENEDLFENLCLDLLKINKKYENTQRNGRRGQRQNGVDIFARIVKSLEWIGIQCKVKTGGIIEATEIDSEINKSLTFNPKLTSYYIYTTAKRDASIQEYVRNKNDLNLQAGLFSIEIYFWEDIETLLKEDEYKSVHYKYYRELYTTFKDINPTSELEKMVSILIEQSLESKLDKNLSEKSMEILVKAFYYNTNIQVRISGDFSYVKIGSEMLFFNIEKYHKYPSQIIELLEKGFLSDEDGCLNIASKGELFLQGLIGNIPTYTQVKVKCLNCGLHFIICTWDKERHTNKTIHCPECGAHNGANLIWIQEKPGFIFEDVPGQAMLYNME